MGARLGEFLRVIGSALDPATARANQAAFMQEEADIAAGERQKVSNTRENDMFLAKSLMDKTSLFQASLQKMPKEKRAKAIQDFSAYSKGVTDQIKDPQIGGALKSSVGDGWMEYGIEEKKKAAPKVINVKEGGDTVARQWNSETGEYEEIARGKSAKGQTINVNTGGSFNKKLGEYLGKDFVERRNNAFTAVDSLTSATKAVDLLDSGIISGTGANFITGLGKALHQANLIESPTLANTEAYAANQAKQVAQIIKAFGAGTGLSDADREYAEKAAAAKITMTEESLRKIININAKASRNVLERYNKDASQVMKKNKNLPFDLMVPIPNFAGAEKKETLTDDEYNAQKKRLGL